VNLIDTGRTTDRHLPDSAKLTTEQGMDKESLSALPARSSPKNWGAPFGHRYIQTDVVPPPPHAESASTDDAEAGFGPRRISTRGRELVTESTDPGGGRQRLSGHTCSVRIVQFHELC
jgi:hypothetical protein